MKPPIPAIAAALLFALTIRAQFPGSDYVLYLGGVYHENFNSLGPTGTNTVPPGWYVANISQDGASSNFVNLSKHVLVGSGSIGPVGVPPGWNLGTTGDADRSLGLGATSTGAPSGGPARAIVLQIENDSSEEIETFSISYDGKQWRTGSSTNVGNQLQAQLSLDGVTWEDLNNLGGGAEFNFKQPTLAPANTALNGNLPANRVNNIGGAVTLPMPINPGATLYLRWYDYNDPNTDPLLAVDNFFFFTGDTLLAIVSPTEGTSFIEGQPVPVSVAASPNVTNVTFIVDGQAAGSDDSAPFGFVVNGLALGPHTIAVSGYTTSGATVDAGPINISVNPNQAPTVVILTPTNIPCFLAGTPVTNTVAAMDLDGSIARIVWSLDGSPVFTNLGSSFIYESSLAGNHILTVTAMDNLGLTTSVSTSFLIYSPPAPPYTLIVTNGSVWKYYGNGNEPAADAEDLVWSKPGYDDVAWVSGIAQFGDGDNGEGRPKRTRIDLGPATDRYTTIYFRREFAVADPGAFTNLILRLEVDDGAIAYINGFEVARVNMPAGPVTYATLASGVGDDGRFFANVNIDLVNGPQGNPLEELSTLAVEVHQSSTTSADLTFDLMLWGEAPHPSEFPLLTIASEGTNQVIITWDGYTFAGFVLQGAGALEADPNATVWAAVPIICPGKATVPISGGNKFFRLVQ